jgi:hypothetical protein
MKTRKELIWTILILSFIIIFIIFLMTSDLTKYFISAGYVTTIVILLVLLFLVGVWLGRGGEKMTSKEQEGYDEETVDLNAREKVRRKERSDVRRRNKTKPKQVWQKRARNPTSFRLGAFTTHWFIYS